ncbi:MAG TPA: hypothetical protein EYG86_03905 [Crocinitomicaceae bacterium]|nr:hypothetical protein [Crocinitomicaceae bacterium]
MYSFADGILFDYSDPYLKVYVNGKEYETSYYDNVQEMRNPWVMDIDTPDDARTVSIRIFLLDEDDLWNPSDEDDTFDIYGGSVQKYWISVDYEIDSAPVFVHEDGSKDGANELDGVVELEISTITITSTKFVGEEKRVNLSSKSPSPTSSVSSQEAIQLETPPYANTSG